MDSAGDAGCAAPTAAFTRRLGDSPVRAMSRRYRDRGQPPRTSHHSGPGPGPGNARRVHPSTNVEVDDVPQTAEQREHQLVHDRGKPEKQLRQQNGHQQDDDADVVLAELVLGLAPAR